MISVTLFGLPDEDYIALGQYMWDQSPIPMDTKFGEHYSPTIVLGKGISVKVNGKTFGEGHYVRESEIEE